jgi:hypothetical protein
LVERCMLYQEDQTCMRDFVVMNLVVDSRVMRT